jgi:uncharacterized protein YbaR (Trm112 family)
MTGDDDSGMADATGPAETSDSAAKREERHVDRSLLEFLVCPVRKTTLIYDADAAELISPAADLAYPIRDGVPLLVENCARPLTDDDRRKHRIK